MIQAVVPAASVPRENDAVNYGKTDKLWMESLSVFLFFCIYTFTEILLIIYIERNSLTTHIMRGFLLWTF